ncbi:MAG: ribonuclease [Campylobacterota bacterium]|nr:ribonuclease [Campylobacterota bacterium]
MEENSNINENNIAQSDSAELKEHSRHNKVERKSPDAPEGREKRRQRPRHPQKKGFNPSKEDSENAPTRRFSSSQSGIYLNIKDAITANKRSHETRLNPHFNLGNPNASVKITPLGGLEQIGGNIAVIETENSAIIIDVGMSFPDESMHGVDILVPDFSYLKQIKHKIHGIIITHGHEDHIGAVPYLFKDMQFPIYGTPLPLGMIGGKFDEHKITKYKSYFRFVEKRKVIKIGDFEVEWMHVTHSIIDSSAVAITCDAGTVIHTGDFKLDNTPIDKYPTDYHRLAYYGDKGVLCLFSDSTNSHNPGSTKSESIVGGTFDKLYNGLKGRVIMSTFSSNIHRVFQAIEYGVKYGRKVCIIGRSMEKNLQLAMDLEYVKVDHKIFIEPHDVSKYPDHEILIVTTGSQGEPMSALYRMSIGEHRHVKLKPTDTVILSSKAIPGNEPSVSAVINQLEKTGATVAHYEFSEIHVSGHAGQEEQKYMLRLTKPKFFLPVHGEYQHRSKHIKTAIECGVDEKNTLLIDDGDTIEITSRHMKKIKTVRIGKTYIDNQMNKTIDTSIVHDRQSLANDGIIMLVIQISQNEHKLLGKPVVTSYGLVNVRKERELAEELEEILEKFVTNSKPQDFNNIKILENNLRQVLKKHIFRKLKRYPIIVPNIFVQ